MSTLFCYVIAERERKYHEVFNVVGGYDNKHYIALKPDAAGIIQSPHKIPYSIQPNLKSTLDTLEKRGIIASVDQSTEWMGNLVIVEKNLNLRLCLDPKPLSAAILRDRNIIPTPSDVQACL